MTDIVVRLRDWEEYDEGKINDARVEAADEITRLRAENEKLRAALLPFARIKAGRGDDFSKWPDTVIIRIEASVRELKAARAALEASDD